MLTDDELQELYEKHCRLCGTQRCTGIFDEFFREECPYYKAAINGKKFTKRTGIDLKELYDEFVEHINSMTTEELLESAHRAAEMTACCCDDWPENLVEVVRCKDCVKRYTIACPMFHYRHDSLVTFVPETSDYTNNDGFCDKGVAR